MEWNRSEEKLPPQGTKVVCFHDGDCWVAQRFGDYWLNIPYTDSKLSSIEPPDLWKEIDFPYPFEGKIHIQINGLLLDIDELQVDHPNIYREFVDELLGLVHENAFKREI